MYANKTQLQQQMKEKSSSRCIIKSEYPIWNMTTLHALCRNISKLRTASL